MYSIYFSPSAQEKNIGVSGYGTEEFEMNLIADIAVPMLEYIGFRVWRNDRYKTLDEIVADSRAKNPDIHFALHSNAGGGSGAEIYYYDGSVKGKLLATAIYHEISEITPMADRGIKINTTFAELKRTNAPSALLEVAYHDNPTDVKWIMNHREDIARGVVKGICSYFGVQYREKAVVVPAPSSPAKIYRVQVGAYAVKENADAMIEKLKKLGINGIIV